VKTIVGNHFVLVPIEMSEGELSINILNVQKFVECSKKYMENHFEKMSYFIFLKHVIFTHYKG